MADRKTVLVVGASRGLGLGLVREYLDKGWRVIATTRGRNDEALHQLAASHADALEIATLDVTDLARMSALEAAIGPTPLDVLFVSAGVTNDTSKAAGMETPEEFTRLMLTNALAPMAIIEAIGDKVAHRGAIVAMTSVLGSVAENTSGGYEVYRASKAALNTMLRSYAHRHEDRSIVAMHPGWVRTDMGGPRASVSVDESAAGMVEVVEWRLGTPGCIFVDFKGKTIAW